MPTLRVFLILALLVQAVNRLLGGDVGGYIPLCLGCGLGICEAVLFARRKELWIWPISPSPKQVAQAHQTPWWKEDPLVEEVRQEFLERKIGPIEYEFKIGQIVNECLKDADDISRPLKLPREHIGDRWEFNEDLKLTFRPHPQPKPQPKPRYTPSLPQPGDTIADSIAQFDRERARLEAKIQKLETMVLDAYRIPPYYPSSSRSIPHGLPRNFGY